MMERGPGYTRDEIVLCAYIARFGREQFDECDIRNWGSRIHERGARSLKSGHLGRPRQTNLREVFNAIQYVLATGCQWRALPGDFPPHSTVMNYFTSGATAAFSTA